jgi:hypothetical protein
VNRRQFLKLGSGALVASATMAEAGMLDEFLSWLKRKPAYSFPTPNKTNLAFLNAELEKRDSNIHEPLSAVTWGRSRVEESRLWFGETPEKMIPLGTIVDVKITISPNSHISPKWNPALIIGAISD